MDSKLVFDPGKSGVGNELTPDADSQGHNLKMKPSVFIFPPQEDRSEVFVAIVKGSSAGASLHDCGEP